MARCLVQKSCASSLVGQGWSPYEGFVVGKKRQMIMSVTVFSLNETGGNR